MFPGTPCHFVDIGVGCTIYPTRPTTPCRNFQCEWLIDEDVPDFLRPSISGVVMVAKSLEGHQYLFVTATGNAFDENRLSWAIVYGVQKYSNVVWQLQSREILFVGTPEFMKLADGEFIERS
jgi:hypothetical protein